MAKYLTLANDSMLVGLDESGHVRDLYFPYVGLENHVSGASGSFTHRIGVWVDGKHAWLNEPSFKVEVYTEEGVMGGLTHAVNEELEVLVALHDVVDHEKNIFVRHVTVTNTADRPRMIKLYFAQQFRIAEDRSGSTGFYDPRVHAIIHYKGQVNFLINAVCGGVGFDDYSVGLFNMESRDGTYIDAEDGELSKNPIEHGSVDSVIGFSLSLAADSRTEVSYWVAAGRTVREVHELDAYMKKKGSRYVIRTTENYWRAWLRRSEEGRNLRKLGTELRLLYEESLFVMRAHSDAGGGIIASSDSDILNYGRDTYSYVWPRDGAIIAGALDSAGYSETARQFFIFMGSLLEPEGYLMHKYRPDGALGSSWHPWMWQGKPELPIQEDETATVLFMLWKHFERTHDMALIESLYHGMIQPMGDFLLKRIDRTTKLPVESYDLWEETFGTSTYTSASVYGGLVAAAEFAKLMGNERRERTYRKAAESLKGAIGTVLFNEEKGIFLKYIRRSEQGLEKSDVVDLSGLHGLLLFEVFSAVDPRIARMFAAVERELKVPTSIGGYMRYAGDRYYRIADNEPSNPWIVTTLWIARYHIKKAGARAELEPALRLLEWTRERALSTYLLPEQMHPHSGAPLSATPLVWSHAEYVLAVNEYLLAHARLA